MGGGIGRIGAGRTGAAQKGAEPTGAGRKGAGRTRPPEVRRGALLDAGEALLRKDGEIGRVEDVTARAGLSKGAFYLHFESKEALLAALRRRFIEGLLTEASQAAARAKSYSARIDAFVEGACASCLDPRTLKLHAILFTGAAGHDPDLHALSIGALERLIEGDPAGVARARTAAFLYHGFHGALEDAAREKISPARFARDMRALFRRVLLD